MIFFGDIASPDALTTGCLRTFFEENHPIFDGKRPIYNFEGSVSDTSLLNNNNAILFNDKTVLSVLKRDTTPVFCLANNHILDIPEAFEETISLIRREGILFCGAGHSWKEAGEPLSFTEKGRQIILFNACWDFLLYSQRNPSKGVYIAEINERRIIDQVKSKKENNPGAAVVVFLHWSLDQEFLPFPMYRRFARDLIDAGADIIVGSHSHCVQGGEKYKDGFIVYGLGNFFIPHNVFIKGRLKYPDFTRVQLSLEWNPVTEQAVCHWFKYVDEGKEHRLIHLGSERFEESPTLKEYSPYQNMSDDEYLAFFREKRRKRVLIPVYTDYTKKLTNYTFTFFLKTRARFAHLLARLNIINWQN